jgi:hypothetical protein
MVCAADSEPPFENIGPVALRSLWLRFHERELCQDLDAVFSFYPKGLEVWCLVEDERSFQRFLEMAAPLKASFEIAVYATRRAAEKKSDEDKEPPPSLWNNAELKSSLELEGQDPFFPQQRARGETAENAHQSLVKQRLLMWSAQILGWRKKVQRYATDLPELARLGFGSGAAKEMRSQASAVCLAHAQGLDKNLARILEGMAQALPKPEKGSRRPSEITRLRIPSSPQDLAALASAESLALARRVYRFIYPQEYTVGVEDLKDPALLESMRELRKALAEFQKIASGA